MPWRHFDRKESVVMDDNLPKPRRWFRFSLRTVFVLVTLLATSLGLWSNWDYIPGTIERLFIADGPATYYHVDGSIERTVEFRDGALQ